MFEAYLAEFVGTAILILLGNGVVAGVLLRESKGEDAGWVVITFAWGLAVMTAALVVGPYSGAHLNPALTLGLASIGSFEWADVPGYIVAQVLGAMAGAAINAAAYRGHWAATEDPDLKLAVFCTAPAIRNKLNNVITEVVGTFVLVFGILGISADAETAGAGPAPLLVGLLVVVIGMSLGGPTGYAINPARDLGPRLTHALLPLPGKGGSDWDYAWVPVVGPIIGGILGAVVWNALGFTI